MDSQEVPKGGFASLVSGIIGDIKDLFTVEVKIAKAELWEELRKAKFTVAALAIAVGSIAIGVLLLLQMLVLLVQVYTALPLWSCYGIVGSASAAFGALLLLLSKPS